MKTRTTLSLLQLLLSAVALGAVGCCLVRGRSRQAAPTPASTEAPAAAERVPLILDQQPAHVGLRFRADMGDAGGLEVNADPYRAGDVAEGMLVVPGGLVRLLSPAELRDVAEGYMPTLDGLAELTVEAFADDEFRTLTAEKAAALLPLDPEDAATFRVPGRLEDVLVGGLPTREDAARGFRSSEVRELLAAVQAIDLVLVDLDLVALEKRSPEFSRRLEDLHRYRDTTALQLMGSLERETGYPHWSLLFRARQAWAR